jgi:hypothetical protein
MLVSHPESLVLRGVSVLGGGSAVSLRLGSYETKEQTAKATPFSTRHPATGCHADMPTSGRAFPTASVNGNRGVPWAGRLSRAGAYRWPQAVGGPLFTAAVRLCLLMAKPAASVADVFSRRPVTLHDFAFQRDQRDERGRQEPPARIAGPDTRTPPAASTRGSGCR